MRVRSVGSILGAAALVATFTATFAAAEPVPITAQVSWTDASGSVKSGKAELVVDGTTLRGEVKEEGRTLTVNGTVDSDGHVSGSVTDANGAPSGTFAGQLGDNGAVGQVNTNTGGGTWSAPGTAVQEAIGVDAAN
jgi:hypothetical protein